MILTEAKDKNLFSRLQCYAQHPSDYPFLPAVTPQAGYALVLPIVNEQLRIFPLKAMRLLFVLLALC